MSRAIVDQIIHTKVKLTIILAYSSYNNIMDAVCTYIHNNIIRKALLMTLMHT